MISGIVLDKWKAQTFRQVLKTHGLRWTEHPGITDDTYLFKIKHKKQNLGVVHEVVRECERRAQELKSQQN